MAINQQVLRILLWACALLSGCSFMQPRDFVLLATSTDTRPIVARQQWQITRGDQSYAVEVIAERSPVQWRLIVLNMLGQRLATVDMEAGQVRIERLQGHPANQLLPDLLQVWQLSYWPAMDLQTINPRWTITDSAGHREARFSDILRASIDYPQFGQGNPWQGSLSYSARDLQVRIHSQLLN